VFVFPRYCDVKVIFSVFFFFLHCELYCTVRVDNVFSYKIWYNAAGEGPNIQSNCNTLYKRKCNQCNNIQ
jgi:hypothetical protein